MLSKPDLEELEKQGIISLDSHLAFSAFSLNLRIGELYTIDNSIPQEELTEMPQKEFIRRLLPVPLPHVATAEEFYLWRPVEKLRLPRGFYGEITSRSSWARLAVRVESQSVDERLRQPFREYNNRPLCSLKTTGTSVALNKYDQAGQLFLRHASEQRYVGREELRELVKSGAFPITRDGKALSWNELKTDSNSIALTMGRDIKIYNGGTLTPGNLSPNAFTSVTLDDKGIELPKGTFFLSASAEAVMIPESYVGNVREFSFIRNGVQRDDPDPLRSVMPLPFTTHANAPYVGPKTVFTGRVTFENWMKFDDIVKPGMLQSELELEPLSTPLVKEERSRYFDQREATASRL